MELENSNEACLAPVRKSKSSSPIKARRGSHGKIETVNITQNQYDFNSQTYKNDEMAKCLEGMNLNKVTLKQYQDLFSNINDETHAKTLLTQPKNVCTKKLRVISSSYLIPI